MSFTPTMAIADERELIYGVAPKPVECGLGPLVIGGGTVMPEVNFTLPTMDISESTWPKVIDQYRQMVSKILRRAIALEVPGLVLEFEHLPPMTMTPHWGAEITGIIRELMDEAHERSGLKSALRVTPVDLRDANRPPTLRSGEHLERMLESFQLCAEAGAHILSIESVGGKELNDAAMLEGDLAGTLLATGVLASRDMEFLWTEIVKIAHRTGTIPGGDTACGFANTAMVLADRGMLPATLAAIVRALGGARTAVAHECGAVGPTKDCAYEGPVMKALFGVPISMEGKSAACAHLSHVGNIAAAAADLWSNESVQNVRLLAADAPEVFTEILTFDCRLMNIASERGQAMVMRNWLVDSDLKRSPHALIIGPEVSWLLAKAIASTQNFYERAKAVSQIALNLLRDAHGQGDLALAPRETAWFSRLQMQMDALPDTEEELLELVLSQRPGLINPTAYGY